MIVMRPWHNSFCVAETATRPWLRPHQQYLTAILCNMHEEASQSLWNICTRIGHYSGLSSETFVLVQFSYTWISSTYALKVFALKFISKQQSKIMLAMKNNDTSLYVRLPMISYRTEQGGMLKHIFSRFIW